MTEGYYIVIGYGEKVFFRDGTILRLDKEHEERQNDIELYIDRLVKVPDGISEEEAEKLIREKRAYKFNPIEAYEEIKQNILKMNKHLSSEEFNNKLVTETRNLLEKIRVIEKKAFGENLEQYENAIKKVSEQLKKVENKENEKF